MKDIIKFDIVKHDKIWGNEQWIVSAHPNGISKVTTENYKGLGLDELYDKHKELFGTSNLDEFPLLVKIIEADDHLSVQVHPDDEYAKKYENSLGKSECWYVLDCEAEADIVIGHNLKDDEELKILIENNDLESKLNILPIKKGDFFYIPAGTIHAIRGGTKILEVQQSSDVTYRLYDYGRLENGQPRELHIDKSIDVVDFKPNTQSGPIVNTNEQKDVITYVDTELFTVESIKCHQEVKYEHNYDFVIGVVLSDNATINGQQLSYGQGFLIPAKTDAVFEKGSEIYISYIK